MAGRILVILGQVGTLFIMMGVGYLLGKIKAVNDQGLGSLTYIMTRVCLPCAVIRSLMVDSSPEFLRSIGFSFVLILGITLVAALVSTLLFRSRDPKQRPVLQEGAIYGNAAFLGIALVQTVFGDGAVIYATLIVIVETIFLLVHSPLAMSDGKFSIKSVLLTPGVIAFAIGLVRLLLNISLPGPISSSLTSLAGMNSPLAMLIVGIQMSKADLRTTFTQVSLYSCAFIKLIAQPLLILLVLLPLHLDPLITCTIVICKATMQSAVLSVFAEDYGCDSKLASQLIALSSILMIATLPVITVIAQFATGM